MSKIALIQAPKSAYPKNKNFRPTCVFPETPFPEVSDNVNYVYDTVRESFYRMGYDADYYGTKQWNPLKEFVYPGDNVLIKPNMVMHVNPTGNGTECLYTQVSVVAAVLDYVIIALKGSGQITVADAPMQACDFDALIEDSGYKGMIAFYRKRLKGVTISLRDLRGIKSVVRKYSHQYIENNESKQVIVKLNDDSEFASLPEKQIAAMRVTCYDPDILNKHHNAKIHEYAVANEIIQADVIINMPKCKTHRKAGITAALKNIVGITSRKEYLPHHTNGAKYDKKSDICGDGYLKPSPFKTIEDWLLDWRNRFYQTKKWPLAALGVQACVRMNNMLARLAGINTQKNFSEGSWYGNNTISKTITDLNKILFYADKNGKMSAGKKRRYIIVADMVIAGEGDGPLRPSPTPIGLIGVGDNPVTFDEVIATIYGAKMEYMASINQARKTVSGKYPLIDKNEENLIISNNLAWNNKKWFELSEKDILNIIPTDGWKRGFKKVNSVI